jgi:hypothetical protein
MELAGLGLVFPDLRANIDFIAVRGRGGVAAAFFRLMVHQSVQDGGLELPPKVVQERLGSL